MSDTANTASAPTVVAAKRRSWLSVAVTIVFALFYAWDFFEAITNLFGVVQLLDARNEFLAQNDLAPVAVPWVILIINMLLPLVGFAIAWWLGRRRSIGAQAILFVTGLAVVAALTLTLTSLL